MTGLENNRANLLLGLIIRQRPKRDFLPVDLNESTRIVPEVKPIAVSTKETRAAEEDEKKFLSSLTTVQKKEKDKPLDTTENVDEPVAESPEEPSASEETNILEPLKPLRFLPGVLVGWGGELPPLPDVEGKPGLTVDDIPKTQSALKTDASSGNTKSPTAAAPRERFIIKKKEAKAAKGEPELSSPTDVSAANNSSGKDAAVVTHGAPLSLKDKPPDVSTEAFLATLSTESSTTAPASKGDACLSSETEKGSSEGNSLLKSPSLVASEPTSTSKPALSGILKKSSAYSSVNEDVTVVLETEKANHPAPSSPKPVPPLSNTRNDPVMPFHQGYLQLSQPKNKPEALNQTVVHSEKEDPAISQPGAAVIPTVQGSESELPVYNNSAPFPMQQPQEDGSYSCETAPDAQDQNHSATWAQDSSSQALSELQSQYSEGYSEPSDQPPSLAKDYRRLEERYNDPWDRPRNTDDRDHHGRHSHHRDSHHGKKSRHHDRERDKKHDRSHDDKYRERSRHHGHSEERYGEKRKERHHSDDYSGRHKDKHRHRRDSDYENGRRSSKDSYS